ncbi:MAG: hypothetical protein U5N26_06540 [Candidatus Marinimicrobia bacterium]|nr:hypothetical protein [Candidatus Neomarinimicrobiota bacterium]
MSRAYGVNAAAITDHSFDLDDAMGAFHEPDPKLPRWKALTKEIRETEDFIFLPGEEVSCGNEKAHNVHLLVYFNPGYIYGDDDNSGGKARQRPKLVYSDIFGRKHEKAALYAAHAAEKAPFLHKMFLHRGDWHILRTRKVHGFQIFNGRIDRHVRRAMHLWSKSLLEGRKQFIMAGNDTHGNFNRLQRVLIPNILLSGNEHIYYGRQRTGLLNARDQKSAETALRNGRMIVSNAYSLECEVKNEAGCRFFLGDRATGHDFRIRVYACSDAEYGPFKHIRVYFGDLQKKKEILLWHGNRMRYERQKTLHFTPENPGYIRAELTDRLSGWKRFTFTNPIWLN